MAHRDAALLGRAEDRVRELLGRATAVRGVDRQPAPDPADQRPPRQLAGVIGDCALYERGTRRPGTLSLAEAGAATRGTDGFVWIGLQQPTADEVAQVAAEFDLPALAVEDAVKAHQRPKLEVYDNIVFAVLKPVRYVDSNEVVEVAEVAIFVGEHFVVTVRHGDTDVLRQVRAELDSGAGDLPARGPLGVLYRAHLQAQARGGRVSPSRAPAGGTA